MSALQLEWVWAVTEAGGLWPEEALESTQRIDAIEAAADEEETDDPPIALALYRKHTERILRRYLYASLQVGRAPSLLCDPVGRGWVSSRRVRTFEDALIFVLDVERCLDGLGPLDKALLSRIVLQEYTQAEAAALLRISPRAVCYKLPMALDRLTEKFLERGVLVVPGS